MSRMQEQARGGGVLQQPQTLSGNDPVSMELPQQLEVPLRLEQLREVWAVSSRAKMDI